MSDHFHFGHNITHMFDGFVEDVFTPWFHKNYGEDNNFAGYILDPGQPTDWRLPYQTVMLQFTTSWDSETWGGLRQNVHGKARFSLRTGLDSGEAMHNLHLVLPGDFPYAGFIRYRGFWAGGSGVKQESDVHCVKKIIDDGLVPILSMVNRHVIEVVEWGRKNDMLPPDWKYLDGTEADFNALEAVWRMST